MDITISLNKDFERCLDDLRIKFGEDFELINGVHPSQLDYSEFLGKFGSKKTLADSTIDPNANAFHRDLKSFTTEKSKPEDKLFALNKIFYEIKKKWGLRTAKKWLELEFSKALYLNDASTASYFPYCWANDLTRLAKEGLFFIGENYNNEPPKHLETYFDDVIELISFLSNRQSGAVGIPNVLIWAYYFWKKDCEDGYYLKTPDIYLRQVLQKFIFRLNQPFIRIDQSAFTNVSIFDRKYLEALFGGLEFPDGSFAIDQIEEILEVQKVFMEVVAETRSRQMFTFPVITTSLLYNYKTNKFEDEDFARWACAHNIKWSDTNFFISDNVGVLSNCCFDGNQEFYYFDEKGNKVLTTFKNFVEERLGSSSYKGEQITHPSRGSFIEDPNTGDKAEIIAVSKIPNRSKTLIEIELEDGRILRVTPDQKIMDKKTNTLVEASEILKNPDNFDI